MLPFLREIVEGALRELLNPILQHSARESRERDSRTSAKVDFDKDFSIGCPEEKESARRRS